jgi:hypothetical protein
MPAEINKVSLIRGHTNLFHNLEGSSKSATSRDPIIIAEIAGTARADKRRVRARGCLFFI